ncbi:ABC transporter substrate-binding protein [Natrialba sp. SSL1]|uniref:ABC transporter substrate-binding protein n=1 Tax=Natrialba sp. SSL1 TaxID=1869245 RepID=UPI0008F7F772|nr:ABC transporter substrate-binding protein [Natrialba sp. SSL1]OIB58233.1 Fe3+-hydroxamate ABC transporter substrate-binding protein [Natrialba sp. SSL1]
MAIVESNVAGNEGVTRREYVTYGSAIAGTGLLAGCAETDSENGGANGADGTGTTDGTYSVTMEPVGSVEFETVPERWLPYTADYADMGVALGQADGLLGVELVERFGTHYYEELPGVSVDEDDLVDLWQSGTDTELFYELDADVHLVDPPFMTNQVQWTEADVESIEHGVAPFIGNTIFSRSYGWHDYEYYSLYEAFEKIAEVFQERDRFEAFDQLHDEVLADVHSRLPDENPEIAILAPESVAPEEFYGYTLDGGTQSKQWDDLGVRDALERSGVGGFHETGGTIDYEALLEVDPDAIVIWQEAGVTAESFEADVLEPMRDHSVAQNLTAVENDRVIFGGLFYQGPIINLFQLEMAAQGLFPDEFGGEDLFDRQRVADIVAGEF